ncbi:MAG: tetratricopeptide repeat protein [Spirochaetia bacterium]|jgi:TPR repeat protein|nr:tetratricopeptide repeat protein [Spirochaetia bacterium]
MRKLFFVLLFIPAIFLISCNDKTENPYYLKGKEYYHGQNGTEIDFAKSFVSFQTAAKQGHLKSQLKLADMYLKGEGGPKDHWNAVKWLKIASERGSAEAQLILGKIYSTDTHGKKDPHQAFYWVEKAAFNKLPEAQYLLGRFYLKRYKIEKRNRNKKAERYLKLSKDYIKEAALKGNEAAKAFLNRQ